MLSILVVDNDAANRQLILDQVEALGHHGEGVASGALALAALNRKCYDAVLMDCHAPLIGGYETTRQIRLREPENRRTVVIAVSSRRGEDERNRCLASGMDDYLAKPFCVEELASKLDRWLTNRIGASDDGAVGTGTLRSLDPQPIEAIRRLGQKTGENLLARVIGEYLVGSPGLLDEIRKAMAEDDLLTVEKATHALGGSSAALGAVALALLCSDLEMALQGEEPSSCELRLEAILGEYRQVAAELQEHLS